MGTDGFRLGVDFGTSNTTAVLVRPDGRVRPLLFDGSPVLPSGVYAEPDRDLLVGRDAAHAARIRPECFEPYPKRCIDDETVLLGEVEVPVERMIHAVLRRVAAEAEPGGEDTTLDAVLTCPVGWGQHRRGRLLTAARQVFRSAVLVTEPVAAASYFVTTDRHRLPVGSHALVYDLGAGTFDASVVRRTRDGFEVLATDGLPEAGGLDIDAAIVASLGQTYGQRNPTAWSRLVRPETRADRRASRALWDDVRTGKELLSRTATTLVHIPLVEDDAPLPREELERLARPLLTATVETTESLLAGVGIKPSDLAGLFLVGGASRIPLAASLLHRRLGVVPTVVEQPELVVAEGSLRAEPLSTPSVTVAPTVTVTTIPTTTAPPSGPAAPDSSAAAGPVPAAGSPAAPAAPPSSPEPRAPEPKRVPRPAERERSGFRSGAARLSGVRRLRILGLLAAVLVVTLAGQLLAEALRNGRGTGAGPTDGDPTSGPATSSPTGSPSQSGPPVLAEPRRVDVPDDDRDPVRHTTLSPDGKLVAAVRPSGVRLYDAATLQQVGAPVEVGKEVYWNAAFSPDSRTLITAADGMTAEVRVWDVKTRTVGGTLSDAYWTSCLTYGPTATLLAVCDGPGSSVRLWDPSTRRNRGRVDSDNPATIRHVAFSPDGKILATDGGSGATLLWDVATRTRLRVLQGLRHDGIPFTDPGAAVAFGPDGKTLATGQGDGAVILWNVADGRRIGTFDGRHGDRVASLAFSPDGRTLASLGGTTLQLWDVASRKPAARVVDGIADYYSALPVEFRSPDIRFSGDGRTLIGCFDNHLLMWDTAPLHAATASATPGRIS